MFDSKGNVTLYRRTVLPAPSPVNSSYSYDLAGNITGMTYPSGRYVGYQRDATATKPPSTWVGRKPTTSSCDGHRPIPCYKMVLVH